MTVQVVPMLPCADVDQLAEFCTALDFTLVHQQHRPNPYIALQGPGFPLHYYGLAGHDPATSHSTCGVVVESTQQLFDAWASGLRRRYGRLPMWGHPRITRPRERKNAGGASGFSLIDPAGNWIRVMHSSSEKVGSPPLSGSPESPLRVGLLNAVVLADSKGDPRQAAKILRGALRRADPADPSMSEATEFMAELDSRLGDE